jgi:DNA invertase Pin-like site-specific DNA recombinase
MKRTIALCYVRKSLVRQGAIDPISPEYQQKRLADWCEREKLTPEWHIDASGHNSGMRSDRPSWMTARRRLQDGDVAALVVTDWDRAARDTQELLAVDDQAAKHGVRFVSLSDNIDTRTPEGRIQLTIVAGAAEYYARKAGHSRRLSIEGLRRQRGRHYGQAPFGTERVIQEGDRVLVPSRREQVLGSDHEALQRVFELYARERLSYHGATRALNAEGWRYRNREGTLRPWTYDDVRRVIQTHWVYAGFVTIGRAYRDMTDVINGSHAPILSTELTTAAAERLRGHRILGPRKREPYAYPLTNLLYCTCGQKFVGATNKGVRTYVCRTKCPDGHRHMLGASVIEAYVRDRILSMRLPDTYAKSYDASVAKALLLEASSQSDETEAIRHAIDRLSDLYATGDMPKDEYRRRRSEYESRLPRTEGAGPVPMTVPTFVDIVAECGPEMLRDFARNLIDRIDLAVPDVTVTWAAWCRAGGPKDGKNLADF